MEAVAELMVLAMAMLLAAFFCLRVLFIPDATLFIPDATTVTIDKAYEVEEPVRQEW